MFLSRAVDDLRFRKFDEKTSERRSFELRESSEEKRARRRVVAADFSGALGDALLNLRPDVEEMRHGEVDVGLVDEQFFAMEKTEGARAVVDEGLGGPVGRRLEGLKQR